MYCAQMLTSSGQSGARDENALRERILSTARGIFLRRQAEKELKNEARRSKVEEKRQGQSGGTGPGLGQGQGRIREPTLPEATQLASSGGNGNGNGNGNGKHSSEAVGVGPKGKDVMAARSSKKIDALPVSHKDDDDGGSDEEEDGEEGEEGEGVDVSESDVARENVASLRMVCRMKEKASQGDVGEGEGEGADKNLADIIRERNKRESAKMKQDFERKRNVPEYQVLSII